MQKQRIAKTYKRRWIFLKKCLKNPAKNSLNKNGPIKERTSPQLWYAGWELSFYSAALTTSTTLYRTFPKSSAVPNEIIPPSRKRPCLSSYHFNISKFTWVGRLIPSWSTLTTTHSSFSTACTIQTNGSCGGF